LLFKGTLTGLGTLFLIIYLKDFHKKGNLSEDVEEYIGGYLNGYSIELLYDQ